jgi:uncharacterized pyridoxamine 5'-phosphate oxidase family protein
MQDVLEKLKDDMNYYGSYGKQFLSNSDIGNLLNNPQSFGKSRGDSKPLLEGRYFHHLLLEPEKAMDVHYVDVTTRTTKEYKKYCEDNNIEICMLAKEKQEIEAIVSIMKKNITFFDAIYNSSNQYEVPAVKELFGIQWKGKADIVCNDCIIDLKTTSDINKFKYSAKAYNYDSQCYIYQELFGKPLVFYAVDKLTYQLGIFRPTESFVRGGELKVMKAVDVYNRFFGYNATEDIVNYFIDEELL